MKRMIPLSSKNSSGHHDLAGAKVFTYPPMPADNSGDMNKSPDGRRLRAEGVGGRGSLNQPTAEQKEQQSRDRGFEEGKATARIEFEQNLTQLRAEIGKALQGFSAERDSYFHRVEGEVVRLALAIVRKILHRESQVDPLLLTGVLRVALEKVGANTTARLRANPADIKVWRDYFTQARENFPAPELVGDPDLEPSRCILETELGATEIGLETQLKEIEQGFLDLLAQRPGPR
jgi:flagellar assembly protein FliH